MNTLEQAVIGAMPGAMQAPNPASPVSLPLGPSEEAPPGEIVERTPPDPAEARRALVTFWTNRIKLAEEYWEKRAFEKMRKDMKLARGDQWATASDNQFVDDPGTRYVANIVLRHIQQRTASIYGKNPKIVARRKERLMSTIWDGSSTSVLAALETLRAGVMDPNAMALVMDAQQTLEHAKQLDKIAKTLQLLYEYEIAEQVVPFKVQMKATVRRTLTTGVGWVKLGFQRVMKLSPELEQQVADLSQKLATIEQLSADIADGERLPDSPEAEQLRLAVQSLKANPDVVVREGLTISYPDSTAIIPDPATRQLRGFVGAEWVAERFMLSPQRVQQIYGVDVSRSAFAYSEDPATHQIRAEARNPTVDANGSRQLTDQSLFCVWEIYNKADGLVYVVCDGWPDFLIEPAEPDVWLERFWPWFAFVTNEVYDERTVYPPSDVSLIEHIQHELNRARQGLREHRRAARPKIFTRRGFLEQNDKDAIRDAKAHEIVELNGLPDDMPIEDALMGWAGAAIRPELYETGSTLEDYYRVVGAQEANLGGTSGATATETSIAEGSRMSSVSSVIDDLDEFLTEFARAAGQILFANVSAETVRRVVGPGAVWPEASREEIAREIYLDIEAASTGRPNKSQEVQNVTQVMPLLLQIPGLSPEWLARELLRRLDDRLDLTDAFAAGMPSIQMLNGLKQQTSGGPNDPNAQGPQGGQNAPGTEPAQVNAAPRPGAPPPNPGPAAGA